MAGEIAADIQRRAEVDDGANARKVSVDCCVCLCDVWMNVLDLLFFFFLRWFVFVMHVVVGAVVVVVVGIVGVRDERILGRGAVVAIVFVCYYHGCCVYL